MLFLKEYTFNEEYEYSEYTKNDFNYIKNFQKS